MAALIFEQQNGPTLTDPAWPTVEAALRGIDPLGPGYFVLSRAADGYLQVAGSKSRAICEWRQLEGTGRFRHGVLGRPGQADDPTSVDSAAGKIRLRANEVLTIEEVVAIFHRYYDTGEAPGLYTVRDVTAMFGPPAAT
jgi:hypothetical protein